MTGPLSEATLIDAFMRFGAVPAPFELKVHPKHERRARRLMEWLADRERRHAGRALVQRIFRDVKRRKVSESDTGGRR